jgi:glycosyltransferase involved in cell wall biosynthesis
MPLVDVITPTIPKRAALLAEARESVARQTFRDIGHLVSVDEYHLGAGALRNAIIARSDAPWLAFLDDDDLLDSQWVEWHLEAATASGADMIHAPCRYPPRSERRPAIAAFNLDRMKREGNYIPMTALVRRSAFNAAGGFTPGILCEDYALWLAMHATGARFEYLPRVCWTYRLHGRSGWKP